MRNSYPGTENSSTRSKLRTLYCAYGQAAVRWSLGCGRWRRIVPRARGSRACLSVDSIGKRSVFAHLPMCMFCPHTCGLPVFVHQLSAEGRETHCFLSFSAALPQPLHAHRQANIRTVLDEAVARPRLSLSGGWPPAFGRSGAEHKILRSVRNGLDASLCGYLLLHFCIVLKPQASSGKAARKGDPDQRSHVGPKVRPIHPKMQKMIG